MGFTTTPNMELLLPIVFNDVEQWGTHLNTSISLLDLHDHTSGKGIQVPSAGLNIDDDVNWNANQILGPSQITWSDVVLAQTGTRKIYVASGDLYYNDGNGVQIQITSGGTVNSGVSTDAIARNSSRPPITDIDWDGFKLINLADPTSNQDAATKFYVDSVAGGGVSFPLLAPSGTNLAPSYSFSSSSGSGLYFGSSPVTSLRFSVAGTERLRIDAGALSSTSTQTVVGPVGLTAIGSLEASPTISFNSADGGFFGYTSGVNARVGAAVGGVRVWELGADYGNPQGIRFFKNITFSGVPNIGTSAVNAHAGNTFVKELTVGTFGLGNGPGRLTMRGSSSGTGDQTALILWENSGGGGIGSTTNAPASIRLLDAATIGHTAHISSAGNSPNTSLGGSITFIGSNIGRRKIDTLGVLNFVQSFTYSLTGSVANSSTLITGLTSLPTTPIIIGMAVEAQIPVAVEVFPPGTTVVGVDPINFTVTTSNPSDNPGTNISFTFTDPVTGTTLSGGETLSVDCGPISCTSATTTGLGYSKGFTGKQLRINDEDLITYGTYPIILRSGNGGDDALGELAGLIEVRVGTTVGDSDVGDGQPLILTAGARTNGGTAVSAGSVIITAGNATTGSAGNVDIIAGTGAFADGKMRHYVGATLLSTLANTGPSVLQLDSSSQGFLPPRVANTAAVSSPVAGLIIFDLSDSKHKGYDGTTWQAFY